MKQTLSAALLFMGLLTAQKPAETLFQQALMKERSQGDLKGAIALYQQIASDKNTGRPLAAKALLEMARCQEKQGGDQARQTYERILKDYADQTETAAIARTRMGAISGRSARQLWTTRTNPSYSSISSDGRYISSVEPLTQDVIVRDLQANTTRRLTNNGPTERALDSRAEETRFSPNGKQIAYIWAAQRRGEPKGAELRVVNADGSNARTVAWHGFKNPLTLVGWTPDGSRVVVGEHRSGQTTLYLVTVATGEKHEIPTEGPQLSDGGGVSPDGKWISLVLTAGGKRDIHIIPISGGAARPLASHPAVDRDPIWAPDGRSIYFLSDRGRETALWQVPVKDGEAAGNPTQVRPEPGASANLLGLTSRGSLIYSTQVGNSDIYSAPFDVATRRVTAGPEIFSTRKPGGNMYPSLSADGKKMVWINYDMTNRSDRFVTVRDMVTGEEKTFPTSLSFAFLTPDGSRVLLTGTGPTLDSRQLSWLDPVTGVVTPLTTLKGADPSYFPSFSFSPDGKVLYFPYRPTSSPEVLMVAMDLGTLEKRDLCKCGTIYGVSLSPDGKQLVSERWLGDDKWELVLIPVDGSPSRSVGSYTGQDVRVGRPIFTPDGRSILTRRRISFLPTSTSELLKIDVDTGKVESTGFLNQHMIYLQIDSQRGRIYFQAGAASLEFWIAENIISAR